MSKQLFMVLITIGILAISSALVLAAGNQEIEEAVTLFEEGKLSEARKAFEEIIAQDEENPTAVFFLGKIFMFENEYDKAVKWLEKAVALDGSNYEYHFWLAQAYGMRIQEVSIFQQAGMTKKLKAEFEKTVELKPDFIPGRIGLMQFYLMAPGIAGGSKEKAKAEAEKIAELDPKQGYYALGIFYMLQKQYEQAEAEYLKGLEEFPGDLDLYYTLSSLYLEWEKYDKAVALLERVQQEYPEETEVYYLLGKALASSGENLDRAEECLRFYLTLKADMNNSFLGQVHYLLGQVYEKMDKKNMAGMEYETALKLDPDLKEAAEALKKLGK